MIKYEGDQMTLICDKCGFEQTAPKDQQFQFADAGWIMNSNAKKYVHLCYSCQDKKTRKAIYFVREHFGGVA